MLNELRKRYFHAWLNPYVITKAWRSCQKVSSSRKTFNVTAGNTLQTLNLTLQKSPCQNKVVDLYLT